MDIRSCCITHSTDLDVAVLFTSQLLWKEDCLVGVAEKTVDPSSLLVPAGFIFHLGYSLELSGDLGDSGLRSLNLQNLELVSLKSFTNN